MPHMLYQVDAFTQEPFKGNPAGVCLLEHAESNHWMQNFAGEMNLSETAFLLPKENGWRLRWFTPTTEVDLCGHATLASAKVLFETQPQLRQDSIKFFTQSGELQARWRDGLVELDFPAMTYQRFSFEPVVEKVLGFRPIDAVFSGDFFLFVAEDEALIKNSQPDIALLKKLPMPEVIITALSRDLEFDFISRFFAPQLGIDEDPVTGSAHCLLTPFWAEKLLKKQFDAYQASPRGGKLTLRWIGDRVRICGAAKIIFIAEVVI